MFHVGLSGYSYRPWHGEGRFYPPELKPKQFFGFYAERYQTVEMDGTWYRMPSEKMVEEWVKNAPKPFTFCPKMHRQVTHMSRLKEDGFDSAKFFLKRLEPAADAGVLGPVLVQLPPNMKIQLERLVEFLKMLPLKTPNGAAYRYAMEFRNETWETEEVSSLLASHSVAWVASDTDEKEGVRKDTAPHAYIRLRKTEYSNEDLAKWAEYFRELRDADKEVFVYCKHDDDGSPWIWADELKTLMC
ncbi:MAG TPA: DUF72 domain-containing protein [Fimbriimonadaceae bacterium]|nr:DUF72 domain-containing protein [Fimbriimonadaceae bacterium]